MKRFKNGNLIDKMNYSLNGAKLVAKNDWSFVYIVIGTIVGITIAIIRGLNPLWAIAILIAGLRDIQAENDNSAIEEVCDMFGQDVLVELKRQETDYDVRIRDIKDRHSFSTFVNHAILILLIVLSIFI